VDKGKALSVLATPFWDWDEIGSACANAVGADLVVIWRRTGAHLVTKCVQGPAVLEGEEYHFDLTSEEGIAPTVLDGEAGLMVTDLTDLNELRARNLTLHYSEEVVDKMGMRSALFVPVLTRIGQAGVIAAFSAEKGKICTRDHLDLVRAFSYRCLNMARTDLMFQDYNSMTDLGIAAVTRAHDSDNAMLTILSDMRWLTRRIVPGYVVGPEASNRLRDVKKALDRRGSLVKDLVSVSASNPKRQQLTRLAIGKIVESEVDARRADMKRHQIQVTVDIQPGVKAYTRRPDIRAITRNLLDNSIYFLAKQRGQKDRNIDVTLRRVGDRVELVVRDDGPGVSRHDHERIFDLFSSIGKASGTGIGLFAVRFYAERAGGSITLDSRPISEVADRSYTAITVSLLSERAKRR